MASLKSWGVEKKNIFTVSNSAGETLKFEIKDASQMQNALQGVAMALTAATMMNKEAGGKEEKEAPAPAKVFTPPDFGSDGALSSDLRRLSVVVMCVD